MVTLESKNKFSRTIEFIKSLFPDKDFVVLHEPKFIGMKENIIKAIDSTFMSSVGEYVNKFKEAMAEITGIRYAIATVNVTTAMAYGS